MIISGSYYLNNNTVDLAKDLLGKIICTKIDNKFCTGMIVETEAYDGLLDAACHAYNKKTKRTAIFYKDGGISYVYLCYGIHFMFNIITGDKMHPNAVLIRAIEPIEGINIMLKRRNFKILSSKLSSGPGKLSKCLGINLKHNNISLQSNIIFLEDNKINKNTIHSSKRIGIDYAGEAKNLLWRFYLKDNAYVSK